MSKLEQYNKSIDQTLAFLMLFQLAPFWFPLVLFFTFGPMIFFAFLFSLWLL